MPGRATMLLMRWPWKRSRSGDLPPSESAALYRKGGAWFVAPEYRCSVGYHLTGEPWVRVAEDNGDEVVAVAATVLDAMAVAATKVVPPPKTVGEGLRPMLDLAGETSERRFNPGAAHVGFRRDPDSGRVIATPHVRDGPGWSGLAPEQLDNTVEALAGRLQALTERSWTGT